MSNEIIKPPIPEDVVGDALEAAVSHDIKPSTIPAEAQIMIDDSEPAVVIPPVVEEAASDTSLEEPAASAPVEVNTSLDADTSVQVQRKAQRVIIGSPVTKPGTLTSGEEVSLPPSQDAEVRGVLDKLPNISLLDTPEGREWAQNLSEGLALTTFGETFLPTMEDPEAEFTNDPTHAGISLAAKPPAFSAAENQNLKGERAVIRMIDHLGLGTIFQVPLWHSGMWVTFKPPSETEIVELNRLLTADKIQFGRYTYGLVFSNITAYTIDRLMEFALSHVYNITAKAEDVSIENLKAHIACQDIPSFLWGFICTMYPRGFKYRTSCIADPTKCNHVVEEILNVSKLQWVNRSALSEWQRNMMTTRQPRQVSLDTIKRYKEELSKTQRRQVTLLEGTDRETKIMLRTPSALEYINAGHRWIGDIVATVDKAIGVDASNTDRNELIVRHGQASTMRQYVHWIESIELKTNIIDDRETIENTLTLISADDEIRAQFTKAVVDYINGSTIAVIGIPTFDCPACSKPVESNLKLPNYTNIIPLDVIQLFFVLFSQRLENMADR